MTEIKYKSEVKGKGGIVARVVAHSKSAYSGKEIVTFEYEAPKCILAEINTHRLFSRNAQSSRAVPISKVIDGIRNNPVTPIHWGSNQPGMVAGEEIDNAVQVWYGEFDELVSRDEAWQLSAYRVAQLMESWDKAGYHKQIVNRIGEAFTMIKGVISATEFDNFFHLRIHPAADPFIQELARCMWEALQASEAEVLYEGEWHLPYVDSIFIYDDADKEGLTREQKFFVDDGENTYECDLEYAKQVSAAGAAQVSFRKLDLTQPTVDRVYSRLVDDETPHSSCTEHQASPMKIYDIRSYGGILKVWPEGYSHLDRDGQYWSGNFMGFVQNRKLIPNEACNNYKS